MNDYALIPFLIMLMPIVIGSGYWSAWYWLDEPDGRHTRDVNPDSWSAKVLVGGRR